MIFFKNIKKNASVPLEIAIILGSILLSTVALAIPFAMMGNVRNTETVPGTSLGHTTCSSWEEVDPDVQASITKAANDAGIEPAILATVYWDENGKKWKPKMDVSEYSCNSDGCGPFQAMTKGVITPDIDTFDKAAAFAAKEIKGKFKASHIDPYAPINVNTALALFLAYNRGQGVAQYWVDNDFPPLTRELIFEYDSHFEDYNKWPVGAQDDYNVHHAEEDHQHTQWWYAEIGLEYAVEGAGKYWELVKGCHDTVPVLIGGIDATGTKDEIVRQVKKQVNEDANGEGSCVNFSSGIGDHRSEMTKITVKIWEYNGGGEPIDSSMVLTVNPACADSIAAIFADIYSDPSHPQIDSDESNTYCYATRGPTAEGKGSMHVTGVACDISKDQNACGPHCYSPTGSIIPKGGYWRPGNASPNTAFSIWSEGYDPRSIGINSPIANAFRKHHWGRGLYSDSFGDMMHFSFNGH